MRQSLKCPPDDQERLQRLGRSFEKREAGHPVQPSMVSATNTVEAGCLFAALLRERAEAGWVAAAQARCNDFF